MNDLPPLQDEFTLRIVRARELMEVQKLDALLLFTGPNLFYFTGAGGAVKGRSGSRPYIYLLPCDDEPLIIVHDGRIFETRATTDVRDVRTYTRLSHLPIATVLGALSDRGLQKGRIGMELGMEMVMDIPFGEFLELRDALSDAQFVDASPLLWQLRMIKSPGEIARLAKACEITTAAYERTFAEIRPGMIEKQVDDIMCGHMRSLGGDSPWLSITSGQGNYDNLMKGGGSRTLEIGDMVWIDCGCAVEGYWSDFSRAGVVGGQNKVQEECQRKMYEITQMGMEMVREGVQVAAIARRSNEALDALDWHITSNVTKLAGRVGHAIGMFVTELPSLSEEDTTILASGMVVTVEPGIATDNGIFMIEENLVVTGGEPRVLTKAPWELRII